MFVAFTHTHTNSLTSFVIVQNGMMIVERREETLSYNAFYFLLATHCVNASEDEEEVRGIHPRESK
jgi:hypothetical protein